MSDTESDIDEQVNEEDLQDFGCGEAVENMENSKLGEEKKFDFESFAKIVDEETKGEKRKRKPSVKDYFDTLFKSARPKRRRLIDIPSLSE